MSKRVLIGVGVALAVVIVVGLAIWLWPRDEPNRSGLAGGEIVSTDAFVFQDDEGKYLCPPDALSIPSRLDPEAGSPRCDAPADEVIRLKALSIELPPPNDEDIRVAYMTLLLDVADDGNSARVEMARLAPEREP